MIHAMVLASAVFFGTAFLSTMLAHVVSRANFFGKVSRSSSLVDFNRMSAQLLPGEQLWPQVQTHRKLSSTYMYNPMKLEMKLTNRKCPLLVKAMNRLTDSLHFMHEMASKKQEKLVKPTVDASNDLAHVQELHVDLSDLCEEYPHAEMEESYHLTVSSTIVLSSDSVWGILRGMETLTQLFYIDKPTSTIRIKACYISDYPLYSHRGLMLDTARRFIAVEDIITTLNAMSMNKLNVLHWHIVDDESFPYQSTKHPELSAKGAFSNAKVYNKSQIQIIIEHAKNLGIRIYPEFSIPGRTRSWGLSHPEIVTQCLRNMKIYKSGPLNPLQEGTFNIIVDLFREVQQLFPDKYFHMGGDRVDVDCWFSQTKIKNYSLKSKMTMLQLQGLFMEKVAALMDKKAKKKIIVMQDVFETGHIVKDAVVQVKKLPWQSSLVNVVTKGHQAILTAPYRLDDPKNTFYRIYKSADPRTAITPLVHDRQLKNILGGEGLVWTKNVSDSTLINTTWPRAMALAELLWSGNHETTAYSRAQEHIQRMRHRGIKIDYLLPLWSPIE